MFAMAYASGLLISCAAPAASVPSEHAERQRADRSGPPVVLRVYPALTGETHLLDRDACRRSEHGKRGERRNRDAEQIPHRESPLYLESGAFVLGIPRGLDLVAGRRLCEDVLGSPRRAL